MKLKLLLASESPRRKEILQQAGLEFSPFAVKVSEILEKNLNPEGQVLRLARLKGEAALTQSNLLKSGDYLVVSADTLVASGEKIFGKPESAEDACLTLKQLSGQTHSVWTGVWCCHVSTIAGQSEIKETFTWAEQSEVEFFNLEPDLIREYVSTGEPLDKAGAYAIQGEGRKFVKKWTGSYNNIVGFPIESFLEKLKAYDIQV